MITTSLEAALLVLTIEFGVLAVTIAFFSYRGARTVEAETTADATELVSKVSNTEDARRVALQTVFKDKYQFDGDELTAAVDEFMQREKAFYNAVVGAFLGRGTNRISNLNDELTKVVAPWISITPKNMVDKETVESLAADKTQVEGELSETKQVLDKMMAEYNRAFRIDPSDQSTPAATSDEAEDQDSDDILFSVDLADDDTPEHKDADLEASHILEDDDEVVEDADTVEKVPDDPVLVSDMIEELDEDDVAIEVQSSDTSSDKDEAPELVSQIIEELDDDDIEVTAESAVDSADKPMTADDLDELMESLEIETQDETEPA